MASSIRAVFLLAYSLGIISCVAQPQSSNLIGVCKQLTVHHQLFEGGGGGLYSGSNMLTASSDLQLGRMIATGDVAAGTKVKVIGVLKNSDGSYGAFLRVEVEIIDGPYVGTIADVPACVPYHPSLKWVESCSLDANEISLNEELTEECSKNV